MKPSNANNSVFREAKIPVKDAPEVNKPGVTDVSSPVETKIPGLFATYEESLGRPFVADYFDITNVWDKEEGLSRDVREIEGYIREKVSKNEVSNRTKDVEKFIIELERKAGLTRYENTNRRIQKLLAYIDFKRFVEA